MWATKKWVKQSPARIHTKPPPSTPFDLITPDQSPLPVPPRSPIHKHSVSFKDIESLLTNTNPNPPLSPLHKHSLSYKDSPSPGPFHPGPSPARHHNHLSFKDIHSLLSHPTRKPSIFHRVRAWAHRQAHPPPDSNNKVVIYYTSLRVVRRTFEDCRAVRSILKGYRVKIDERDLSMDGAYVEELQRIIKKDKDVALPMVYVNGRYVGGVEEVRRAHESGELKRMIQGLPMEEKGVCGVCGGYRFVVCEHCDGSHRVFVDKLNGFRKCDGCNADGLIKCPCCTSVLF